DAGAIGNATLAADEPVATHEDREADEDEDEVEDQDQVEDEDQDADQWREPSAAQRRLLEADRVSFGEELWGASERHRAAAFDAETLRRLGLPPLASERDLADWLGISLSRLRWYTHDRPADTTWHYVRYTVPKRSGGERVILAPKRELKALQRKVLAGI